MMMAPSLFRQTASAMQSSLKKQAWARAGKNLCRKAPLRFARVPAGLLMAAALSACFSSFPDSSVRGGFRPVTGLSSTSSGPVQRQVAASGELTAFDQEFARLQAETRAMRHELIEQGAAKIDASNGVSLAVPASMAEEEQAREELETRYGEEQPGDGLARYPEQENPYSIREVDLPRTSCGLRSWVSINDPTTSVQMGTPMLEDRYIRCPVLSVPFALHKTAEDKAAASREKTAVMDAAPVGAENGVADEAMAESQNRNSEPTR